MFSPERGAGSGVLLCEEQGLGWKFLSDNNTEEKTFVCLTVKYSIITADVKERLCTHPVVYWLSVIQGKTQRATALVDR